MFCPRCGKEIRRQADFCPSCGASLKEKAQAENRLQSKCKNCNAVMNYDAENGCFVCSYCGSREVIHGHVSAAAERVRLEEKRKMVSEIVSKKLEAEKKAGYQREHLRRWSIFFAACAVILLTQAFEYGFTLYPAVLILQILCFIIYWLMGRQIIPGLKKGLHRVFGILGIVMIIPVVLIRPSYGSEPARSFTWPESGLAAMVSSPVSQPKGVIFYNDQAEFNVTLESVSQDDFNKYAVACKEQGFTEEYRASGHSITSYNQDGFKLDLYYYASKSKLDITITAPMILSPLEWSQTMCSKYVSAPDSDIGKIQWENKNGSLVYVGNMSHEKYSAYVTRCMEEGFTVDYYRHEDSYSGDNADGVTLYIRYEGRNIISVQVIIPTKS